MDSSSSSTKMKTKLSARNQTRFKKTSLSSTTPATTKKKTNLSMREETIFNKAYELSTLCDIQVCVLYYGPDGDLIKTWPEDPSMVRDMAERFSKLIDREKRKKSTNLSQFLNKKINDEKKKSLEKNDNKFSDRVLEMEDSLKSGLRILQDRLRFLHSRDQTEPDQRTEQNHNFADSSGFFSTDLSSSLINDPLMNSSTPLIDDQSRAASSGFSTHLSPSSLINGPHQQWAESSTNHLSGVTSTEQDLSRAVYSGCFATDSSNQHQGKYSIFLYNHSNGSFSQLGDSVSSLGQAMTPYNSNLSTPLLGAQEFGLRSCSNNMMNIPPQMQTQNPLVHFDQFAAWNQTPSFVGDPMMFSSYN